MKSAESEENVINYDPESLLSFYELVSRNVINMRDLAALSNYGENAIALRILLGLDLDYLHDCKDEIHKNIDNLKKEGFSFVEPSPLSYSSVLGFISSTGKNLYNFASASLDYATQKYEQLSKSEFIGNLTEKTCEKIVGILMSNPNHSYEEYATSLQEKIPITIASNAVLGLAGSYLPFLRKSDMVKIFTSGAIGFLQSYSAQGFLTSAVKGAVKVNLKKILDYSFKKRNSDSHTIDKMVFIEKISGLFPVLENAPPIVPAVALGTMIALNYFLSEQKEVGNSNSDKLIIRDAQEALKDKIVTFAKENDLALDPKVLSGKKNEIIEDKQEALANNNSSSRILNPNNLAGNEEVSSSVAVGKQKLLRISKRIP